MALPILILLGKLLLGGVAAAGTAVAIVAVITLADLLAQVVSRISQLCARGTLNNENPYVDITEALQHRLQDGRPLRSVNIGLRDVTLFGKAGELRESFTLEGTELDPRLDAILGRQRQLTTRAEKLKMIN